MIVIYVPSALSTAESAIDGCRANAMDVVPDRGSFEVRFHHSELVKLF